MAETIYILSKMILILNCCGPSYLQYTWDIVNGTFPELPKYNVFMITRNWLQEDSISSGFFLANNPNEISLMQVIFLLPFFQEREFNKLQSLHWFYLGIQQDQDQKRTTLWAPLPPTRRPWRQKDIAWTKQKGRVAISAFYVYTNISANI